MTAQIPIHCGECGAEIERLGAKHDCTYDYSRYVVEMIRRE